MRGVAKICAVCDGQFYARQAQINRGGGRSCSQRCHGISRVGAGKGADKARAKARGVAYYAANKAAIKERVKKWRLSDMAARPQVYRARLKAYRTNNPEKTREWFNNRRARGRGRLPKGWIAELRKLQRGKCAVCHSDLGERFHTDHIVPLSGGGKHAKGNVQLLCATCNVRKSAKDPIAFMQERGMLL